MNGETVSKEPCPNCALEGRYEPLRNRPGFFGSYCQLQHKYPDTEELLQLKARARAAAPQVYAQAAPPQAQSVAPVGPPPPPQPIVLDEETRRELETILGQTITNASQVKGLVRSLMMDLHEAREAVQLKADGMPKLEARSDARYSMLLPEWFDPEFINESKPEGMSIEEYLEQQFTSFMETYFEVSPTVTGA